MPLLLLAIPLLAALADAARAEEPAAPVKPIDFQRDILPIFASRCFDCHGEDAQEGQLRLDAKAIVMRGGVSGRMIESGDGKGSLLVKRLLGEGDQERMPLDDDPLTGEEIALVRRWIDEGAKWPDGVGAQVTTLARHWAYIPPSRAKLPQVSDPQWIASPIDAFILARLDQEGLKPSPPADRARLLRRVHLDLIGLPPTPEAIEAFLADEGPGAYERVVERLLASPEYGQRWARPWLDAARYADTNGYQADQFRSVWPYRDWVVDAMNADMSFERFTREQLAGDLLSDATLDQKIATGFHRLTTCNVEAGVDPEENRVNQIIDRVNTTGTVWLGTTVECTQCHNHKYDPFSQQEYYRLFAYFNNTPLEVEGNGVQYNFTGPKMDLPLSEEMELKRENLQTQVDALTEKVAQRKRERLAGFDAWLKDAWTPPENPPQWHVLPIAKFHSREGAAHEILDDHSVLLSGADPDVDEYTVTVETDLDRVTGFKLEALTDPSLPGEGPGRRNDDRPNFVLNELRVTAETIGDSSKPVQLALHAAEADFENEKFKAAAAIDGDPKTGWAIHAEFHKPHYLTVLTASPPRRDDEQAAKTRLTITLTQQHGQGRTIGRLRLSAMTGRPTTSPFPEAITKLLEIDEKKRSKKQNQQLEDHYVGLDAEFTSLEKELAAVQAKLTAVQPDTTLVMIEQDPRDTNIFKRGNFLEKGEPVKPGTPRILHAPDDEAEDRLGLARWLTDRDNPLTARVTVNRWWAEIFGQGIVATLEDFGTQGEPPTHPQVLDWLACEFMDSGWSMKHVHRLIVTSNMYRQSSKVSGKLLERDPYNKLHARAPRFRLPAETVRDNALRISGLLTCKLGGPPVYPPQPAGVWRHVGRNEPKYDTDSDEDRFRRGLYVIWRRSAPYPAFTNFDAPDRASCVVARPRTNTPLQALTLLNDPQYLEMARALAERMAIERSELTINEKIAFGFQLCVARDPNTAEVEHLEKVYRGELARFQANPAEAAALIDEATPRLPREELAAWFYVANILLNLDETITRN
ncbi:MAG: PSD1 and planctomycete cytochrome C domain-containing protein [Pirellulaceae bacterium]